MTGHTNPAPLSPAKREALAATATRTLYFGRDPGSPWQGTRYATATLRGLMQRGLIRRGQHEPGKGRRLTLTDAGRAALPTEAVPAPSGRSETAPTTRPAQAGGTLRDRIGAALRNALKTRTVPPIVDYLGRPITGTEIGLTEHELADVALTVVQPLLDELADYRNRITWETTCGGCARTLDAAYAETMRAETAEAERDRLTEELAAMRSQLTEALHTRPEIDWPELITMARRRWEQLEARTAERGRSDLRAYTAEAAITRVREVAAQLDQFADAALKVPDRELYGAIATSLRTALAPPADQADGSGS
ncbi:hypothetical protein ABZX65_26980 [Streptomyces sp. NPDC003300]|uniref:hypothetical protein n=1 Tax=unclassified Streptomyces TaxID=2593676 RepID=UPI0033A279B1